MIIQLTIDLHLPVSWKIYVYGNAEWYSTEILLMVQLDL